MKRRSPLIALFVVLLSDILGLSLLIPLLPFYAEKYDATPFVVGLLFTCYALCQLISGPILGKWSDRVGRKPLLFVSQLGTVAGLLLLANAQVLWLIFVARCIDGLTAGNISLAQAYIADVTPKEKRAQTFGIVIGVAFGLGFFVGPAVSGVLYAKYGFAVPIYGAAALSFTSALLTLLWLPGVPVASDEERVSKRSLFQMREYLKYYRERATGSQLLKMLCFQGAFATFMMGFALFAERHYTGFDGHPFGTREVGYVLGLAGLVSMLQQGSMIRPLVKKLGEAKLVQAGFIVAICGYALLPFTSITVLIVVVVLTATGQGAIRPTLTSLITKDLTPADYGAVMGLTQSQMALANIVMPLIAGYLIGQGWLDAWVGVIVVLLITGFAIPMVAVPAREGDELIVDTR